MSARPGDPAAVVFDIDGTLLDSATGIVAGFRAALLSVGVEPPDEASLYAALGPPIGTYFASLGLDGDRLVSGVEAYRRYYWAEGMYASAPYPGIADLLDGLAGVPLATATAKRTDTAERILAVHGLAERFAVIAGTDEIRLTKAETLAYALERLGDPDPARVLMIGDRHSDIEGARACGVRAVGVTWGYATPGELEAAGADELVDTPDALLSLLTRPG